MSSQGIDILRNCGGVIFCDDAAPFVDECRKNSELSVFEISADECKDEDSFYKRISELFGFPDYFGENPNALIDCMRDKFREGRSIVLHVRGADYFLSNSSVCSFHSILAAFVFASKECRRIMSGNSQGEGVFFVVVMDYVGL